MNIWSEILLSSAVINIFTLTTGQMTICKVGRVGGDQNRTDRRVNIGYRFVRWSKTRLQHDFCWFESADVK